MGKPQNYDPPPPYSATDFDRINQAPSAPQYVPGAPPPSFQQPGAPPPSFQQSVLQQGPPVVVHQVVHVVPPQVGPCRTTLVCPSCHQTVKTKMMHEASSKTHLVCLLLCLLQCYICCLLPYCIDSCQNAVHSCPKCGAYIGTYSG